MGIVLMSLFACGSARAAMSISLEWIPNTDPSIAGYNVYYGGASRSYTNMINVGDVTSATAGGLVEGQTYYFAVTAYTFDGEESDYSDEFVFLVPGLLTMTTGATPTSRIQIRFPVAGGHWYELQQSPDLSNWLTVWQTTGIANVWVEFDAPISVSGGQFYRLILH
jgi:hypothetical protein